MRDLIITGYIGEGTDGPGLYRKLWELGCGFRVDLKRIPIRQETVEACMAVGTDPYEAPCGPDCRLMAVAHAGPELDRLEEAGIPAAWIGYTTEDKDKILKIGDRKRYLNKPGKQTC